MEGNFPSDILEEMTRLSPSIKGKVSQNHKQKDKGESDLEQADEIMDDSASSYYTALCSLSEYSEDLDDRTHIPSTEPLESQDCATSMEGITSKSLIKDTTQEYKTQKDLHTTEPQEVSQGQQDESLSSKRDLLESYLKPLLSSTTLTNTDLQSLKVDTIQKLGTFQLFDFSEKDLSLRPKDYFRGSGTIFHTNIRSAEELSYSQHRSTSNTILTSPDRDQYSKGRKQEHGGTEPKQGHATQQQRPNESWFDRGGHILGNMVTKGEGQGTRNEQAELSLRSRNRKASASCISTFTGSKQESRIPSHYSECISTPGHQHQLQNLDDTWSLKKQSTKGPWLSRSVSYKQCSTLWQPCHNTDNTSMGTKLAEPSGNLAQVRSSCTEPDYLHVFGSCWRPSHQLSTDGSHNNLTDDVLSFKMQMYSNTQNTSACSESSSFECIDIAVESTEEIKRGLKTVPKRQIQLKRRDIAESHVRENNDESLQVPNPPMRTRDLFQRQHSMPEAFQKESHTADESSIHAERKQKLQKSFSLDETSGKTKMASCIITNVLSKKMQHEQNLRTMDVGDNSVNAIDSYSSGKDVHAEITKLQQSAFPQTAPPKIEAQTECSSFQRHNIANSKTQPKPLTKHSFNPLLIGIERSEIQGSGTEITVPSENEKAEKPILREEVVRLPNLSPGPKLSCDSAKSRAWTSSAATNVPISAQASVKTTPEECHMGQRIHQGGSMESTLSPTNIACLISDLEANVVETVPLVDEGVVGEGQESVRPLGQGVQSQGKIKALAPVHVVRDMRSLVKNTYNLPFKGPVESIHSCAPFQHNQTNNKTEDKGKLHRQDEKPLVQKVSPPIPLDKMRDLAFHHSTPRGCSTKLMPPVESNDKSHTVGFTKVSPTSVTKTNSCTMSKPQGIQDSQFGFCKGGVAGKETNLKPTNRKDLTLQTGEDCSTEAPMKRELNGSDNDRQAAFHSFPVPLQYYSPTVSAEQQYHGRMISDGQSVSPRSQSSAGPLSACVLTVASTPIVQHPCYFNANPMGYQTISPHIGYVQGPVLFQTPLYNQPPASNSNIPLFRSLSEDGKMQQSSIDGSTNQSEKEESILNIPSPDSMQNTVFVAPLTAEARLGGTGVLCTDAAGSQNPRQLLLDPETGCCFYVDVPQLPQRKMLFDPQTCQYVEVLLPQQTLNSAVLPSPCPIPFASVHIPPMYTTHCLPFVQAHPQVLQPPGP